MAFDEPIDFTKYGININVTSDLTKLPSNIASKLIPESGREKNLLFTKNDGTTIRITLNNILSKGSYGEGWSTDDKIDGIPVIVKIIDAEGTNQFQYNRYGLDVVQEAMTQIIIYEATKNLSFPEINLTGPFVPQIFLIGQGRDKYYIVSERLDGDIANIISNTPSINFMKYNMLHLSKILGILYEKLHFNHRDLKPDNVMYKIIDKQHHVRLIDFGFSCLKYRKLNISSQSDIIFSSRLHCNSKIRDLHSYVFEIIYDSYYKYHDFPFKRLLKALTANLMKSAKTWKNTYIMFNSANDKNNSDKALNLNYDVV